MRQLLNKLEEGTRRTVNGIKIAKKPELQFDNVDDEWESILDTKG